MFDDNKDSDHVERRRRDSKEIDSRDCLTIIGKIMYARSATVVSKLTATT